jgi:hypothetical protein
LPHDPSIIRGYTVGAFVAAEVSTVLQGPIKETNGEEFSSFAKPSGVIIKDVAVVALSESVKPIGSYLLRQASFAQSVSAGRLKRKVLEPSLPRRALQRRRGYLRAG